MTPAIQAQGLRPSQTGRPTATEPFPSTPR